MNQKLLLVRLWALMLTFAFGSAVYAQFTNTTVPPLSGGNGSGGTTFNLTVVAPILLTEVGQALTTGNQQYDIWMSNTPISGAPTVSPANGWTLIQSGSTTGQSAGNNNPVITNIPLNTPMVLTPGTYGFFIGANSVVYTTYNSSNQASFSDAFTTIETGPGVGYGGSAPNPTFSTRQFNGSITYVPIAGTPDNMAVNSVETPGIYCAGNLDSISVKVQNMGSNQIDSFMLFWDINGVVNSEWYYLTLDTFLGAGNNIEVITLDTLTMPAGATNITVWSQFPNGVADSDPADDTTAVSLMPALNGVYTISANGGDFTSLNDAAAAADNFGICGPTVFELADTLFVEQVEWDMYEGLSATNNITIRSAAGVNAKVAYSASGSADNFVFNFTDASHYIVEDVTLAAQATSYGVVIRANGGTEDVTIQDCHLIGVNATSSTSSNYRVIYVNGTGLADWTIANNTIENGNYGIYYYGSFSAHADNVVIEGNSILNPYNYGAYIYYTDNVVVNNNHLTSSSSYSSGRGIYVVNGVNIEITNNYVEGVGAWPYYGIYVSGCSGDLNNFAPITNNRVYMPGTHNGYGMYSSNGLFTEFANNSIYYRGGSSAEGMYITNGQYNNFFNNIVSIDGGGTGVYIASGNPVYQMDYNNVSAPGGTMFYEAGQQYGDLASWVAATGFDSNSLNVNMVFSDTVALKVCNDSIYGAGKMLSYVMYDFEGDLRQDPPCIGADEFMPISMFAIDADPVLCTGDTMVLVQQYFDTVIWNSVDTADVYVVSNPQTIWVEVRDFCGVAYDTVTIDPQLNAQIIGVNLCENDTVPVSSSIVNGQSYTWSTGETTEFAMVSTAQTIWVEVVDEHGCVSSDTNVITASDIATLPDSAAYCEGSSVTLDPNAAGTSYLWSDGSTTGTVAVNVAGNWCVTVTDLNCQSVACADVSEILEPTPAFVDSSSFHTVVFTNLTTDADQNTTYLWDFGDGTTSTDFAPIHVYPYGEECENFATVTLTVSNDCGSWQFVNDSVAYGACVSVEEVSGVVAVDVFPNPSTGNFTIVSAEGGKTQIQVLDLNGKIIYAETSVITSGMGHQVDVSNVSHGVYILKVMVNQKQSITRLILE